MMKKECEANLEAAATAPENETNSEKVMYHRQSRLIMLAVTLALILSCFIVAAGQTAPPKCESAPLEPTNDIASLDGVSVNSALVMKIKTWYWLVADTTSQPPVPVAGTKVSLTKPTPCAGSKVIQADLRTYGFPKDPGKWNDLAYLRNDNNLNWVIPGPTFHIKHGQNFNLTLYNRLPPEANPHKCDNPVNQPPNYDASPDCFHGNNITNIHFHGFRVSPSAPQDNVFLELYPEDPKKPATTCASTGDQATGCYSSRLDTIQDIQAVGTNWYHPHKHGATALQVINGMSGAFIVEGYFDDELQKSISKLEVNPSVPLEQKTLVVQQIKGELNFFNKKLGDGGQYWVNGQRQPIIFMKPGEIQRWRFVAAMQQIGGFLGVQFQEEQMRMRQIAQDGVPFDPVNYARQPLDLTKSDSIVNLSNLRKDRNPIFTRLSSSATPTAIETKAAYVLAPGNRVDLLVVAPTTPGDYALLYQKVADRSPIPTGNEQLALQASQNVNILLVVRVASTDSPKGAICKTPGTCLGQVTLPPLPDYLNDINPEPQKRASLTFSMTPGPPPTPNDAGSKVFIDNRLYDPVRNDHIVSLRQTEEWEIRNTSNVPHPFHIHVNPFQVSSIMGQQLPRPWVWFDTLALPIQADSTSPVGVVKIRQRFLGFTGRYVLHCHILGHEDRGMMQNVLAVP
jgi:FtsP/CotA-like multicopper oxidase with cupredoxin domain